MSDSIAVAGYFMSDDSDVLTRSVRAAEAAGYSRVYLNDAHTLWQDVYVHMTRVLDATSSVRVSSGVTNLVTRHFSVAASAHATLAQLHPGRVGMGLGRGDAAVHTMGLLPTRTAEFREQVTMVRELLRGNAVSAVPGREFDIRWAGDHPVTMMIGATGPKSLRFAGGIADIVQLEVGVHPDSIKWAVDNVLAGAEAAGRDPDDVTISIVCAMWVSDDLDEARTNCRWAAVSAANHIQDVMKYPGHGMPDSLVSVVERRRRFTDGQAYDGHGHLDNTSAETDFLTDELIDNFGIAGDAERCRARIERLGELGVGEIASGFLNGEYEQIERVGRSVIAAG